MEQKDAQLIQQVLQGDQEAFALLVNKYQKGVHALAWRKSVIFTSLRKSRRTRFSGHTRNSKH